MKAVILAGGMGTRLAEETVLRPKPMIEIGNRPIIWHIMKHYAYHGINEFVICCGYKGEMIKEYFYKYAFLTADITIDMASGEHIYHNVATEPWRVTLVNTGDHAMTGGRLLAVREHLEGDQDFCFTYGDGVSDVDITGLVAHHRASGKMATVTAVEPLGRYGALVMKGDDITGFTEKPRGEAGWVSGGFFVLNPGVFELLQDSQTIWEGEPLETLARTGQLNAYKHSGFWQPMDTLRDKKQLQRLWDSGNPPWKCW